ncbi:MAG TPA: ATP-dependent RecD-like DNA helicase [Candidatus Acidoferrales bacterium]|nr:ATP-dependent RecD-like DNA helicase [Candidatus Acidoferrales bacterium]
MSKSDPSASRPEAPSLEGTITKIAYQNAERGYTVARLEIGAANSVTIVGQVFPLAEGDQIRVSGFWHRHPRYGLQFKVEQWFKLEPSTLAGIAGYLGGGRIKGIGPALARRLVEAFGAETLRVLSEEPERLQEVPGIGRQKAERIVSVWNQERGLRETMVFLQGHGITSGLAQKIYRAYGNETMVRVQENPYRLAREISGIGFVLADRIARRFGVREDSPYRVEAGVIHLLRRAAEEGHCYLPLPVLEAHACGLLGVGERAVDEAVARLAREGEVVVEHREAARVYPAELHRAEERVAAALKRVLSTPASLAPVGLWDLENAERRFGLRLEDAQRQALAQALQQKLIVITGGPGTGKTTLLKHLLGLLRGGRARFALAAPTGRAANRMQEMTGEEAKTIHRLLEYSPADAGFLRAAANPLSADVVIIDEASMVDLPLMDHLLAALRPSTRLVLIGDADQLPSVGPGNVLRDLIDSGAVPTVFLKHVFRQAAQSLLVLNAHRILSGEPLLLNAQNTRGDFLFVESESQEEILALVKSFVRERIPARLQTSAAEGVQVITPIHRGLLGTIHINQELQQLLNPRGDSVQHGATTFRAGDRVMQLRNNYDRGVFNGDLGKIAGIDRQAGRLFVQFERERVEYPFADLDELALAYATSVHKSQGSEYPAVVIPVHTAHYLMLNRSIFYTAITRAKRLAVLIGSRRALALAMRNARVEKRFTGLQERLKAFASL